MHQVTSNFSLLLLLLGLLLLEGFPAMSASSSIASGIISVNIDFQMTCYPLFFAVTKNQNKMRVKTFRSLSPAAAQLAARRLCGYI